MQDDSFVGNFTCSSRPGIINSTGAIRAFCRICNNISSPDNGLIIEGNYNCLPRTLLSSFPCLYNSARSLPECQPLLLRDRRNVSVTAAADSYYNSTDGGTKNLRYLAMAFKSVSQYTRLHTQGPIKYSLSHQLPSYVIFVYMHRVLPNNSKECVQ